MKKIACLFVMSILVLISSSAYADDGNFTCGSYIGEFSRKTFENLSADFRECQNSPVFDGLTVKDTMVITGNASVRFTNSSINRLSLECSGKEGCEIGLEEGTSIEVLELYPENNNQITINGIAGDKSLPAYYNVGYLCEGQPEFSLYADAKSEIDFRDRKSVV